MFVRYLPFLRSKCKKIIFETRPELVSILRDNVEVDELTVRSSVAPDSSRYDFFVPLMSLPGIAHSQGYMIPNQVPYLCIDRKTKTKWGKALDTPLPKIGLVWAGRPEHANDRNRSCPLAYFTPLLNRPDLNFVSLQKGSAAATQLKVMDQNSAIIDLGSRLNSFVDTSSRSNFTVGSCDHRGYLRSPSCRSIRRTGVGVASIHSRLAMGDERHTKHLVSHDAIISPTASSTLEYGH